MIHKTKNKFTMHGRICDYHVFGFELKRKEIFLDLNNRLSIDTDM